MGPPLVFPGMNFRPPPASRFAPTTGAAPALPEQHAEVVRLPWQQLQDAIRQISYRHNSFGAPPQSQNFHAFMHSLIGLMNLVAAQMFDTTQSVGFPAGVRPRLRSSLSTLADLLHATAQGIAPHEDRSRRRRRHMNINQNNPNQRGPGGGPGGGPHGGPGGNRRGIERYFRIQALPPPHRRENYSAASGSVPGPPSGRVTPIPGLPISSETSHPGQPITPSSFHHTIVSDVIAMEVNQSGPPASSSDFGGYPPGPQAPPADDTGAGFAPQFTPLVRGGNYSNCDQYPSSGPPGTQISQQEHETDATGTHGPTGIHGSSSSIDPHPREPTT